MLTSLGFDTIVVNNRQYDDDDLCLLFDLFCACGIKNFIFLSDFNFENDSFSIERDKIISFKNKVSSVTNHKINSKVFLKTDGLMNRYQKLIRWSV